MAKQKIAIIILIATLLIALAIADLDNSDINALCNTTNSYLYKNTAGNWGCRTNIYGEMYNYSDGGYQVGMADFGVYYNITRLTCGENNGVNCTTNATTSKLTKQWI